MTKVTDIGLLIIGIVALLCVNALAFVFDGEWINVAITLNASFVGALIAKFLSSNTSNSN